MKKLNYLIVLSLTIFFISCAQKQINLNPTFWDQKEKTIGVAIINPPVAKPYRAGGEGLIDVAINNAITKELSNYLKTLTPNNFVNITDDFVNELKKRGIVAKKIDTINLDDFKKEKTIDLRTLKDKNNIDTLIIFDINYWGTNRIYSLGVIPMEAPKSYFVASSYMLDLKDTNPVNLKTKNPLWRYLSSAKSTRFATNGEWDQPPTYPNLTKTLDKNIEVVKNEIFENFFNKK